MSNNKQSSIDWLISQIAEDQMIKAKNLNEWTKIFEQARAMHQEEMINFTSDWYRNGLLSLGVLVSKSVEEYYNKTFKQ